MVIQKWWPGPQPKAAGGEQLGDWLFREKGELARFTQRRQKSRVAPRRSANLGSQGPVQRQAAICLTSARMSEGYDIGT